jgi:hypothetical protein
LWAILRLCQLLDYTALNGRINDYQLKTFGTKRSWLNRGTILAFAWKGRGKPRKSSVRIDDLSAEIRTVHFPNMGQELYRNTNPFGGITLKCTLNKAG